MLHPVQYSPQLSNNEHVSKGDNIEYVYTDSQHQNLLSRVVPAQFIRDSLANRGGSVGIHDESG